MAKGWKSKRQLAVYEFIKEKKEVSQPEILQKFVSEYSSDSIARSAISQMLSRLKNEGYVKIIRTEENTSQGGIRKNIWALATKSA